MADQKISAMPSATEPLTGDELIPMVQDGANVQAALSVIKAANRAYGAFSSSDSQTGSVSAGTALTCTTTDVADGVVLQNDSQFKVPNTGVYNVQFSAQMRNTDNEQHDVVVWARIDGIDVPDTGTRITVPARKTASVYGYAVPAWNFFLELDADQYVELMWLPTSTSVTLRSLPASLSPAYPADPSLIVTVNQVG